MSDITNKTENIDKCLGCGQECCINEMCGKETPLCAINNTHKPSLDEAYDRVLNDDENLGDC